MIVEEELEEEIVYPPKKDREIAIKFAFRKASEIKLKGDYLEFGLFKGSSFIRAYEYAKEHKFDYMNFYGFDSFEGLPKEASLEKFRPHQYKCSRFDFDNNIKKSGMDLKRVTIVEGWYEDVLKKELKDKLPIKVASIIHFDCDLYSSTIPVLKFIKSYLREGSILVFDDYYCPNHGEEKALKELFGKDPNIKLLKYKKPSRTYESIFKVIKI